MDGSDGAPTTTGTTLPATQLPWAQIPSFQAGVTDLNDYSKKLMFLKSVWPPEHVAHLAPRAALL